MDSGVEPIALATVDHPVTHLLVSEDGATIIAASDDRLSAVDAASGEILGTLDLPGIADLAPAGTGSTLVATPDAIDEPAAVAVGARRDPRDRCRRLRGAPRGRLVRTPRCSWVARASDEETRTDVEEAITDGRLAGIEIVDLPRVAVATDDGDHLHRSDDGRRVERDRDAGRGARDRATSSASRTRSCT